jgi:hypothetical protein
MVWKHKKWATFKGTWLIASKVLTEAEVMKLIAADEKKYGYVGDWEKVA